MRYNQALTIPASELVDLGIPSNITEAQLEDSGYTYRFKQHKDVVKRKMAESLLDNMEFEFRITPYGVELIGKVEI